MTPLDTNTDFGCFGSRTPDTQAAIPSWACEWSRRTAARPLALNHDQQQALAQVLPLLLCGEQSAIAVFQTAGRKHQGAAARELRSAFAAIECDEAGHEMAWQTLFAKIPTPSDLHRLRRAAARFFAELGRADTIAAHFAQIAHLDSCVGTIMFFLERSAVAREPSIAFLANRIKRDEARHVAISRKYAKALGVDANHFEKHGTLVRDRLIDLLEPHSNALAALGIPSDKLFQRVSRCGKNGL